jgi:hypothetical protein
MKPAFIATPWHGGPICCAVRLCRFSLVPGEGAVSGGATVNSIHPMKLIKSFCGGPGGGFFKKSPLVAEGKKYFN